MENPKVHLQISSSQLRKLKKGQGFQASHKQMSEGLDGGHNVELEVEQPSIKKLQSALKRGKGFRFNQAHIKGGSLRDIGNYLKEKGKQAIRFFGNNLGTALNYGKKFINQNALDGVVDSATAGLTAFNPALAPLALGANTLAKRGIQKLYDTDYSRYNTGSGMKTFGDKISVTNKEIVKTVLDKQCIIIEQVDEPFTIMDHTENILSLINTSANDYPVCVVGLTEEYIVE